MLTRTIPSVIGSAARTMASIRACSALAAAAMSNPLLLLHTRWRAAATAALRQSEAGEPARAPVRCELFRLAELRERRRGRQARGRACFCVAAAACWLSHALAERRRERRSVAARKGAAPAQAARGVAAVPCSSTRAAGLRFRCRSCAPARAAGSSARREPRPQEQSWRATRRAGGRARAGTAPREWPGAWGTLTAPPSPAKSTGWSGTPPARAGAVSVGAERHAARRAVAARGTRARLADG
jgi:hypothetical protein